MLVFRNANFIFDGMLFQAAFKTRRGEKGKMKKAETLGRHKKATPCLLELITHKKARNFQCF
jgi:hypothetical protein